jgi:6-phosphogluconolactonase
MGCHDFFVNTTSSTSSSSDIIYVANTTTATLSGYVVGTGTMTAVSGTPPSLAYVPQALVVTRPNAFLYAAGPSAVSL